MSIQVQISWVGPLLWSPSTWHEGLLLLVWDFFQGGPIKLLQLFWQHLEICVSSCQKRNSLYDQIKVGLLPSLKILGYVVAWTLSTLYLFHEYHEYSGLSFLNFEFRIFAGEDEKREKEDVIWRRKIYFLQRRRKSGKEKEENIWRRKMCFFLGGEENSEGEGGSFASGQSNRRNICKRPVHPDDHLQEADTG